MDSPHGHAGGRERQPAFVVVCELLLPLVISEAYVRRVPRNRPASLRRSREPSGRLTAMDARAVASRREQPVPAGDGERGLEDGQRGREGLHRRGAGRAHRGRGAPAAAEHRRFRRHARARGDDATPRHRRDSRGCDDRGSARALPRAGVLAVPGVQESLDNIAGFVFIRTWSDPGAADDMRPAQAAGSPSTLSCPETRAFTGC